MTFSVFSRVVCSSLHLSYCHLLLALQLAQILRNGGECPLKRQEFLYCHFKIRIITNYSYCNRRLNPINAENFRKSHLLLKLKLQEKYFFTDCLRERDPYARSKYQSTAAGRQHDSTQHPQPGIDYKVEDQTRILVYSRNFATKFM